MSEEVVSTKSVKFILWLNIIQTAVIALITGLNLMTAFVTLKAASSADAPEAVGGIIGVAVVLVCMLLWLSLCIHAYRKVLELREQAEIAIYRSTHTNAGVARS